MPPSAQKQVALHTFSGGMNSDVSDFLLENDKYREGWNVRILSTAGGNVGILTNPKGNLEVEYELPAGTNKCVGRKADEESNRFYWAIWNSEGNSGWYMYDGLLGVVTPIIIDKTDTGNLPILNFSERNLILHIDILKSPSGDDLIYWTDNGSTKAKKFNINKALDKSPTGYGLVITAEDINAYKLASIFPPDLTYFTDTTREANYLYGYMFKAAVQHWYDDGEKNNWSEFSTVPLPDYTGYPGNPAVTNVNNGMKIKVETGSSIVTHIEIAIKINSENFVSIIVLDKEKLGISDDTTYEYLWYNDNASYSGLDQFKVNRAYSFLPYRPALQAFTKNALVYGKGEEGFETVDIDVSSSVIYNDLFLPDDTTNVLNDPFFGAVLVDYDFTREGHGRRRNSLITITIGHDVRAGNLFQLYGRNGESDNFYEGYLANNGDDASSVASAFQQRLFATGRTRTSSPELPDTDIWEQTVNMDGDVSFSFIWYGVFDQNATEFTGQVNQVSYATLKNNGQSVGNHKSGGGVKYGIVYWDEDTRRSLTYTDDAFFVRTDFVTQSGGFKAVIHQLIIKNPPPVWAKYYSITRTKDLTYGSSFIQFLAQQAIESQSTTDTDYVDLIIGSIYTYQEMFPNTNVKYEFEKNDRVRLIKKEDTGAYYDFVESIVIDFKPVGATYDFTNDVTTNETNTVTIAGTTSVDNIGRYIVIDGIEREIIGAPTSTTYTLASSYGTSETYTSFKIVDKRGILRIRKPLNVTIEDNSLIEVYKPTQNVESAEKEFFMFGQKYAISDWGTDLRAHTGNIQNQDPLNPVSVPAIVNITKGTTYVRNRQLPTNNAIPGTQAVIDLVESASFNDFYISDLNDNGKIAPEDDGRGVIRFGSRLRFSNNYLEGTRINGLNDFDNLDREDYNDPYGDFMLLFYDQGLLFAWKFLRTGYIPIFANIISDQNNNDLLSQTNKLLNQMQYFAWEGGIGNNPESFAYNQTWKWFVSPTSGVVCRIGGDGILPVSEQFGFDSKIRELLANATKYSTFVFGGFDRENNEYQPCFENYNEYGYNGSFVEALWQLFHADYPEGTEYEITQQPQHGTVVINSDGNFVYTPSSDGSGSGSDASGYVGPDYFYYRWREPAGDWTEAKRSCGLVTPPDIPPFPAVYYNAARTEDFVTQCAEGQGTTVSYTVPARKYSSSFSQDDADQQAYDEAAQNGQAYADANGSCVRVLNLRYAVLEADVCDATPQPLYLLVAYTDIVPGAVVYTDLELTTPLTGYSFIVSAAGVIYALSSTTGEVGAVTGGTCSIVGTALSVRYGTDLGTVCNESAATVYVNPAYEDIQTGITVYTDSGLTDVLDGYDYIVSEAGEIFEIDDYTGVVGDTTETSCPVPFEFSEVINNTAGAATLQSVSFAEVGGGGNLFSFLQPQLSDIPVEVNLPSGVYTISMTVSAAIGSIKILGSGITSPSPLCQEGSGSGDIYDFSQVTIPGNAFFYVQLDLTPC